MIPESFPLTSLEKSYSRRIARFPFPFSSDQYRYTANVEPARQAAVTAAGQWGTTLFDEDDEYVLELRARAEVLAKDPSRYSAFPHMMPAQWDALVYICKDLADAAPDRFSFERDGEGWLWTNHELESSQHFVVGNPETLPCDPLEFIGRNVQEDIVLLDQRDGSLYIDATCVTFSSSWSPTFVTGMTFLEMHGPVPRAMADGTLSRAEAFIMRLEPNEAYRRTGWGLQAGTRLDISLDSSPEWAPAKEAFMANPSGDIGQTIQMRIEVQHIVRLPETSAILFTIRSYLLPIAALLETEGWAERTIKVLDELPSDLASYKGLSILGPIAANWLRNQLA